MRSLLYRSVYLLCRALRPSGNRDLRPLEDGDTVLYLQFERPLGCCVHGTPLIDALRAVAPGVRVIVASQGPGAATLRHHPGVDELIELEINPVGGFGSQWRAAAELRTRMRTRGITPTVIVQDASSRRGSSALFAALLRIAPTIGFGDAPALYDYFLVYDPQQSLIDNNLRLPAALGGRFEHREPVVFFDTAELGHARELVRESQSESLGLVAFVMQGSGGQRTAWKAERFAAVIEALETEGFRMLFLGTEADRAGIEGVREMANSPGPSLAGRTTIPEAAAVLALCDLLVTVDTGTMHLGRAASVPMVVLGPSWQKPLEWLPLGIPNVIILRGPDREEVPPGYQLDEITVQQVLGAAQELLAQFPPSESAREQRVQERLAIQIR